MVNRLEPALDLSAALDAVKKAGTPPAEPQTDDPVKFINLRIRGADYTRIGHLAVDAGMTKAAFCKMASLFVADMVASGTFSISGGGIIDRRR